MATKPVVQPELWASNATYTTGPFIGSPGKSVPGVAIAAEGHRPGASFPTAAEHENSQQNRITQLCRWVFLGSSAGASDAHIVETDATGRSTLHGLTVNDTANEAAVQITGVGTIVPAVMVTNVSGGGCIAASSGNTNASCITASVGNLAGDGLSTDLTGTQAGGSGVRVTADAMTAASGVLVNHAGSGIGIEVTQSGTGVAMNISGSTSSTAAVISGGTGQAALVATSGNNAAVGAQILGIGTALGLVVDGGTGAASSTGIRGSAVHADAVGVHGRSAATATNTGTAVTAEGRGDGAGLRATSVAFHAAIFSGDVTAPNYAAIRMIGANARPTVATGGSIEYSTTEEQLVVGNALDNEFRGVWTTKPGKVTAYSVGGTAQVSNSAVWEEIATISAVDGDAPKVAGARVCLRLRGFARNVTNAAGGYSLEIRDVTNGDTPIITREGAGDLDGSGYLLPVVTDEWQAPVVLDAETTVPAAGDRTWRVMAKPTTMTATRFRDISFTADGCY